MEKTQNKTQTKPFLRKVDESIELHSPTWSFSEPSLAQKFDDHIRRSIPGYEQTQNLILDISDYYARGPGVAYDLGCSTGALTRKLAFHHQSNEEYSWVGLDLEKEMILYAREKATSLKNVQFFPSNFLDYPLQKTNFVLICYTLQFMKVECRLHLLRKVHQALEDRGVCLVCEKVFEDSVSSQALLSSLYTKYKLTQGFQPAEILAKEASLRGVLQPLSRKENYELFKKAGFEKVSLLAKHLHFETYQLEK